MRQLDGEGESPTGSIAVTQARPHGKLPQAVRILRCVWRTTRGHDGKTFGRSDDTEVFRLPSGATALSEADGAALRSLGLTEAQLEHINARLPALAALAAEHTDRVVSARASRSIAEVEALAQTHPLMRRTVQAFLVLAASRLADGDARLATASPALDSPRDLEVSPGKRLLEAMRLLNHATVEVQAAYRQLGKGEEPPPEATLEFQRSWFLVPAMVEALRARDCFYRPAGWSELKHQVLVEGRPWHKGEPVPKKGRIES